MSLRAFKQFEVVSFKKKLMKKYLCKENTTAFDSLKSNCHLSPENYS